METVHSLNKVTLDVENVCKRRERPLQLPSRLLAIAGPSNCSPRVLHAMSQPTLGVMDKETLRMCDEVKDMLRYVFQTKNEMTLLQQTSGTGGIETLITNLLEPKQKLLVPVSGVWGERAAQIGERHGVNVIRLQVKLGQVYTLEELTLQIETHKPDMIFLTHGESSHGTVQPLEGLGEICHRNNCLLAVDCVISLGAHPFFVDRWGIDAAVAATQKAIGAPPGMALLTFSPKAVSIIKTKKTPPPFYYDLRGLDSFWNGDRYYYYSYNSNMIAATREALEQIIEEGLVNVWNRHKDVHMEFIAGAKRIGLNPVVENHILRLNAVAPLFVPKDIKWEVLLDYLMERFNIEMSFGIGPTKDIAIRVGIMGYNARSDVANYILEALEEGLKYCRSLNKTDHMNGAK